LLPTLCCTVQSMDKGCFPYACYLIFSSGTGMKFAYSSTRDLSFRFLQCKVKLCSPHEQLLHTPILCRMTTVCQPC
jgi:hypothetical protein